MNIKDFVTENFQRELQKFGVRLDSYEIKLLQDTFDFDAIEQAIIEDVESNTRSGKAMKNEKLSKHRKILKILTKKYAELIYKNYIKTQMISEAIAKNSQLQLKCNSDIYPCEKKEGFGSAY